MTSKNKDYLNQKVNFLFNTDWLDENFICNFLNEKLEIKEFLNKKIIGWPSENVSSRVLTHWQKLGLIIDDRPSGKGWRKFSLTEFVWITIITKLRNFGFELNKIMLVKEYLKTYGSVENQSKWPLLDFYISYGKISKSPVSLIVFHTGESMLARQIDIDFAKQYNGVNDDFITIDLNELVAKVVKTTKNETDYLDYSLSPIEKEIKHAVFFEDVHSLTLKVKGGNEYILDKEYLMSSKHDMDSLLQKLQYAEATTSKRGGKSIYRLKEKRIIKKSKGTPPKRQLK